MDHPLALIVLENPKHPPPTLLYFFLLFSSFIIVIFYHAFSFRNTIILFEKLRVTMDRVIGEAGGVAIIGKLLCTVIRVEHGGHTQDNTRYTAR